MADQPFGGRPKGVSDRHRLYPWETRQCHTSYARREGESTYQYVLPGRHVDHVKI